MLRISHFVMLPALVAAVLHLLEVEPAARPLEAGPVVLPQQAALPVVVAVVHPLPVVALQPGGFFRWC